MKIILNSELQMTEVTAIRSFILAGKSIWTLQSKNTGKHYTYRCRLFGETKDKPVPQKIWWIDILSSGGKFEYLARLKNGSVHIKNGTEITKPVDAVEWFLRRIWHEKVEVLQEVNFYHANLCGRCGRLLTTPESVKMGIGPECLKKLDGGLL